MIVIVGAGITGLALGIELQRMGLEFLLLEGASRTGGVIRSQNVSGHVVEWGPQRSRLTAPMLRLVTSLGLEAQLLRAPSDLDLFVYHAGRLHTVPTSPGRLMGSSLLSTRAKLRLMVEPLTRAAMPGEDVATYFTRKLGTDVYQRLAGPFFGGLYASDPADMIIDHALLPLLRDLGVKRSLLMRWFGAKRNPDAPACSFAGGMQCLTDAMSETIRERIVFRSPVVSIEPVKGLWRVESETRTIDASAVVLTTPAATTAELLKDVVPECSAAINSLVYNHLAVVQLVAETNLRAMGFQVAFTEDSLRLRGVTFHHDLFDRENLYTAFLGGARHPDVAEMADGDVRSLASREFRVCTGFDAHPIGVARVHVPSWNRSWTNLVELQLARGIHIAANWWSRPGITGRLAEAERVASRLAAESAGTDPIR